MLHKCTTIEKQAKNIVVLRSKKKNYTSITNMWVCTCSLIYLELKRQQKKTFLLKHTDQNMLGDKIHLTT